MGIFSLKSKKKIGTRSKIAALRSPYSSFKNSGGFLFRRKKQEIKKNALHIRPARLKNPSSSHKLLIIVLTLLILTGGLYLAVLSRFFDVKTIEISEDGAKTESNEYPLLEALKNKNILFIEENNIGNKLKVLYPDIKKIKIKKILPKKLKIEIEKFPVVANVINLIDGIQKKYLVNAVGYLIKEDLENHDLPYIKIATAEAFAIHTVALPQERLDYIIKAINLFEEKFGIKVLNALYLSREREMHLMTEKNFVVLIDMEKDLRTQMEKLKKALPKLDIYKTPLQYIDLRISGTDNEKVIYKKR